MAPAVVLPRRSRIVGLLVVLLTIMNPAAWATPILYEYGGVITSADPSTGIAPGTRFSGSFGYDPAKSPLPAVLIEGSSQWFFGHSSNFPRSIADGSGLTLQIGGRTVLANPGGVQVAVAEVAYPGQYGYLDAGGKPMHPHTIVTISNENVDGGSLQVAVGLTNSTRAVFGSLAPPASLKLSDFSQAKLNVTELTNPGSKSLYTGNIDTLQEIPVPEPAVATLLCLAAVGWFAGQHDRRIRGSAARHSGPADPVS
jgi:hypothetical protein